MTREIKRFLEELDPLVHLILILAVIILFAGYVLLNNKLQRLSERDSTQPGIPSDQLAEVSEEGSQTASNQDLKEWFSAAIATLAAVPKTVVQQTSPSRDQQTTYIPLDGSYSTQSQDWVDVPGAEAWIDVATDYNENAYIEWEASLKVNHGNGIAYARLFDDTHKIAVDNSQISTINNSTYQQVKSTRLNLWSGRNLYKVQLKSLNTFEVFYTSGRIKVSY